MTKENFHENFSRKEVLKPGSNRSFGFIFTVAFLLASNSLYKTSKVGFCVGLSFSMVILSITVVKPALFSSLNLRWMRFASILNTIMTPIILFFLFWIAIVPTALLLKLFKKDILSLQLSKSTKSYWLESPAPTSTMKEQF